MDQNLSIETLTAELGRGIESGDSLETLRVQAGDLAPALERLLASGHTGRRLTEVERKRWTQVARRTGPVNFHISPRVSFADQLPEGAYDLTVGLRMAPIGRVLENLYTSHTWLHQLPAETAGQLITMEALRDLSDDVPEGNQLDVGPMRFTAAPTLIPVDGTENFVVHQPFTLEVDRPMPIIVLGGDLVRILVTSLSGVLSFGARAVAEVNGDELRLVLEGVANTSEAVAIRIEVDPSSLIQPRSPEALAAFESFVQGRFNLGVLVGLISTSFSLCPTINLPLGSGVPLRVQRIDVRTIEADGGVVMIGVLVGKTAEPDDDAGDPERLTVNPFKVEASNVHLALHEVLVQKIVEGAHESGELERLARQQDDDLRINGARAELKANEVRIILDGKLVDACGPLGLEFKDVGFRATQTYRYAVFGEEIVVTQEQDINLDNTDVAICVALGALQALIAGALFGVFSALADIIFQIVRYLHLGPGSGSDDPLRLNAVFETDLPVPGTELLPQAETLQSIVEEEQLLANGVLTLRDDDVNTYVYATFIERSGPLGFGRTPLEDARVRLLDQDVPRPPGDDAQIPLSSNEIVFANDKRIVTVATEFEPPRSDQLLAVGRTTSEGRVRFVLRPQQIRTTAGTIVTTTTTDLIDRQPPVPPQISTQRTPLRERRPDVFFEVTLSNGRVVDTTMLASGLVVNLSGRRLGSADNPITFVVGRAGGIFA